MTLNGVGLSRQLPLARESQVWLDFDGTVSCRDVLDELIRQYSVDDSWRQIEQQWQAGLIGSRQCLTEQFALLRITRDQLNKTLDGVQLDSGIFPLLELLQAFSVPVAILSDSVDMFIKRILERHGITNLRIRSNTAIHEGEIIELYCPHGKADCETDAAHCKCASAEVLGEPDRKSIYIGDGRSDLCPARKADFVFAKNALAECLKRESIVFYKFSTLNDVVNVLSNAWMPKKSKTAQRYSVAGGVD